MLGFCPPQKVCLEKFFPKYPLSLSKLPLFLQDLFCIFDFLLQILQIFLHPAKRHWIRAKTTILFRPAYSILLHKDKKWSSAFQTATHSLLLGIHFPFPLRLSSIFLRQTLSFFLISQILQILNRSYAF